MKKSFAFSILLVLIFACKTNKIMQEYTESSSGIFIEKFDSTNISEARYTDDNLVYRSGNKYIYEYYYQDFNGDKYYMEESEGADTLGFIEGFSAWYFVPKDKARNKTIRQIHMEVLPGLEPMNIRNKEYNQTVVHYTYPQDDGEEYVEEWTGIIENDRNIWSHPPRQKLFRILELNPFPYVQFPLKIGNKWKWNLSVKSGWGDERWKTWEGRVQIDYEYEVVERAFFYSPKIGEFYCHQIESIASSTLGESYLRAYYHDKYGFVQLEYTNIDSSKLVIILRDFEDGANKKN